MSDIIHLYHGSQEIVRQPEYGKGRRYNDYGLGFYCTENEELAKEWACSSLNDGFANHYLLDQKYLNVLDLNSSEYTILNWAAVLISNRLFRPGTPIAGKAKRYLEDNFALNTEVYDVIKGYRADDAYYDFADAFLNNAITVEQLASAMKLGKLGEQIVLKSRAAFDNIVFVDFAVADSSKYYPARKARALQAEVDFRKISEADSDGLYMIDIIRGQVKNDDPRIPRNLPE
ncbi:MAG: DUF3990 domain-containing protein [Mogibacterium sp.]|nr:DUF3990 domain-containing protein [Mogibacterium sp.]